MGHEGTENISVHHNDDSYDSPERNRVPHHKAKNKPFITHLLGSCRWNGDLLCIHHFAHHASGAVGRAHQNWIDSELLRRDSLQTSEERVR